MYDYGYTTSSTGLGGALASSLVSMLFALGMMVLLYVSLWKIFKKAGKNGWEAIVPFYNIIVLFQIINIPLWHLLLLFVPMAQFYSLYVISISLAEKFGKDRNFGLLCFVLPIVGYAILAFTDAEYEGSQTPAPQPQVSPQQPSVPQPPVPQPQVSPQQPLVPQPSTPQPQVSPQPPVPQPSTPIQSQENNVGTVKSCGKCGNQLDSNAVFCNSCGNKV